MAMLGRSRPGGSLASDSLPGQRPTRRYADQGLLEDGVEGHLVLFDGQIAMCRTPVQIDEVRRKLGSIQFGGGARLYDAIADTCTNLSSRSGDPESPRRAIFLVPTGLDYRIENLSRLSQHDLASAEEIAVRQEVTIYTLATEISVSHMNGWAENGPTFLGVRSLLEASQFAGGQALFETSVEQSVAPLLVAIYRQLTVTVVPSRAAFQKLQPLTLKSIQKGIHVSVPAQFHLNRLDFGGINEPVLIPISPSIRSPSRRGLRNCP